MNIINSALGHYPGTIPLPDNPHVRIGHSFGTSIDAMSPNRAIAIAILEHDDGSPVVVDRTLADAFPNRSQHIDHIVEGQISDSVGHGVGTYGTLVEGKDFMDEEGLELAVQFAQAFHVGRILMQARKLNISSVAPPNLPRVFDATSQQPWTRSLGMWVPREMLGSLVLRAQKKL